MPNTALEQLVSQLTLNELASKSNRSVEQIVSFAFAGTTTTSPRNGTANNRPNGAEATRVATKRAPATSEVDTRSAAGRKAFEASVYRAVADAPGKISASQIRDQLGGTALQIRAALNRLIEDGRVNYEGKARGTRYSLA